MPGSFKDHFSAHASAYATYRPGYPEELFAWLAEQAPARRLAWDCATGNGQAAKSLACWFDQVIATDASDTQIRAAQAAAQPADRITYRIEPAEHSSLPDSGVDLVTVAQAFHWLDQAAFQREVQRVLVKGGVLAIWTYTLASVTPAVDQLVNDFYRGPIDSFWPPERKIVELGYRSLQFPWPELDAPELELKLNWNLEQFEGYLGTWSAVRRYMSANGTDPVARLHEPLLLAWGDADRARQICWPIRMRVFRIGEEPV